MKNKYLVFYCTMAASFLVHNMNSQCALSATLGSASNMFTIIRNSNNPIACDKNLNTVLFHHRSNTAIFGGDNGHLRYDISTDGGTTWTNNIGPLNPNLTPTVSGRYPNMCIYNPTANLNPNNAFLGFLDATVDYTANSWTGHVSGVRQLNGAGSTENYNQAGPGGNMLIPSSLVKGAPGVFWAVDAILTGTTGYKIYKGTWTGSDITWTTNYSVTPSFLANLSDASIAFDPTGQIGYMSFIGHLSGGPATAAYYPVLYKTTNGGATWTGPVEVDIAQFNCISANIQLGYNATCAYEHDLAVDMYGNPHFFTTIGNGSGYGIQFGMWHHMFDITSLNGLWNAYDVANVNAGRGTWGVAPNTVQMDWQPQITRTNDGRKIFYGWSDNATYTLGTANQNPNLFLRGFDVQTYSWTPVKDFTSCNPSLDGQILFPHVSETILEPSPSSFKIPFVFGEFTVAGDPLSPCNFKFLQNIAFSSSDFNIAQVTPSVVIQQGNTWTLCPGTPATFSISGNYDAVLWSNGSTTNSTSVTNSGTYIATARSGCTIWADTIVVNSITATLTPTNTAICGGAGNVTLTVNTNAPTFTWMPGNIANTSSLVVSPSVTTIYSVIATGNNCTFAPTVTVGVGANPTITVNSGSICLGSSFTITPSGANSYTIQGGNAVVSPTASASYTVIGTNTAGCVSQTAAVSNVTVNATPLPTITVNSGSICAGSSFTMTPSGAATYTFQGGSAVVSPTANATYTVAGTNSVGCASATFATSGVTVNPVPSVSVSPVGTLCAGQSTVLNASGANTYSWNTGAITASASISPTITQNYTVVGTNTAGCSNTATLNVVVDPCTGIPVRAGSFSGLSIYPNPNNGSFVILCEAKMELTLVNDIGQIIKTISQNASQSGEIEIANLPAGIYFVMGRGEGLPVKQKIVVMR